MLHAENTVEVRRAPEDVYAFLADGLNGPKWRSGIRSISLRSGEAGRAGAEYAQQLAGHGSRTIDADYRLAVADAPERIEFQVIAGPLRPHGVYRLTPTASGTRVTFALDAEPKGLMKLMTGTIRKTMAAEVASLDRLPGALENG